MPKPQQQLTPYPDVVYCRALSGERTIPRENNQHILKHDVVQCRADKLCAQSTLRFSLFGPFRPLEPRAAQRCPCSTLRPPNHDSNMSQPGPRQR